MSSVRSALLKSAELHLPRRGFLGLLTGALVMPAIIKVAPLMRIKPQPPLAWVAQWGDPRPKMMWYSGGTWNLQGEPLDIDFPPLLDVHQGLISRAGIPLQGYGPKERQALLERWKVEGHDISAYPWQPRKG